MPSFTATNSLDLNGSQVVTGGLTIGTVAQGAEVTSGLKVTTGGITVDTGGLTVTAGGATVTAGGLTVSAGGLTVSAGAATVPYLSVTGLGTDVNSGARFVGAVSSSAPIGGTYLTGDFVIGRNGSLWICTSGGSPGTWTQVSGGGGASLSTANTWTALQTFNNGEITIGRTDTASEGGQINLNRSTDNSVAWYIDVYGSTSTPMLRFFNNTVGPAAAMGFDGTGKLGIGTFSPNERLEIAGNLRLNGSTSGYVVLAPAAAAGSTTYTLPSSPPASNGYVLSSTMGGTMSWVANGSGGGGTTTNALTIGSGLSTNPSNISTFNGSAALTISLNLGNANTWTAAQTFSADAAFTSNTESSSTTTGAIKVTGGIGVSGNIRAGGNVYASNFNGTNFSGTQAALDNVALTGSTSGVITVRSVAVAGTNTIYFPAASGNVVTTGDTGTVTSTMILDGTIVNADISATAAIAVSKLAANTISNVTLGNNLYSLTIDSSLLGTSYNGSGAVTIGINLANANTWTATQTFANATSAIFGSGDGTGTITGGLLRAPSGTGSNIAGGSLTIAGGAGTGTGSGGTIVFQTAPSGSSGSTANTLTERARIDSTGLLSFDNGISYPLTNTSSATNAFSIMAKPKIPSAAVSSYDFGAGVYPKSVYIQGKYAYIIVSGSVNQLKILDVSNPGNISLISSTNIGTTCLDIKVQGKYAYILSYDLNILQVIDISNPGAPVIVNGTATTGTAVGPLPVALDVVGRYAYVVNVASSPNARLEIFDLYNPTAPVSVGKYITGSGYRNVQVIGRYCYIVMDTSNVFDIIDISNPSAPVRSGYMGANNWYGFQVQGRYVYGVSSGGYFMGAYDISNAASPNGTILGSGLGMQGPRAIFVSGRYAYVYEHAAQRISIVDITIPSSLSLVGTVNVSSFTNINAHSPQRLLSAQGRYIYFVAPYGNKLDIFDLHGVYMQSVETGIIETTQLAVKQDASFYNNIEVKGGATVSESFDVYGKASASSFTSPVIYQPNYPFKVNDISSQFNGVKTVFPLKFNQSSISSIFSGVQTEDIDVAVNGLQLEPYAQNTAYPWITPYDWFNGYKVSGGNLVLYNPPTFGDKAVVKVSRTTTISRTQRYPFSAATLALGD